MKEELIRYPPIPQDKNLLAWNRADELLIDHVLQMSGIENKKILIINDQFGALSVNLSHLQIDVYSDSFLSSKSIKINSEGKIIAKNALAELGRDYDLALIVLPKNHSFFEDILCRLTEILKADGKIICTGMVKHISKGHFQLIEKYMGEVTTSLAVKKARLLFSERQKEKAKSPFPKEVELEGFDKPFTHFSNIFSREKLDIGTRFFLQHIPKGVKGNILDLGCGNGILGIKAKLINPDARLFFSDESMMAIHSAKHNYRKYHFEAEAFYFWTHNIEFLPQTSFDLILCNPPFHQGTTVGTTIAKEMFRSSFSRLNPGGRLRIVANSHLNYQHDLKRIFGTYELIDSNKKFIILETRR